MKYFFLVSILLTGMHSFAQDDLSPVKNTKNQKKIDKQIESLEKAGAFRIDSVDIGGEKIDSFAVYPGGTPGWRAYLTKSIMLDVLFAAIEKGLPEGRYDVWVEFIVHENGTVSHIKPITQFGYGLEEGAKKIIVQSGVWSPAIAAGKKVASRTKIFMTFRVESE